MKRTVVLRTPFFVSNALNGLYLKSIQTNHHFNTCYSQVGFRVGRDSAVKYLVLQVDHDDCDDDNDDGGDYDDYDDDDGDFDGDYDGCDDADTY